MAEPNQDKVLPADPAAALVDLFHELRLLRPLTVSQLAARIGLSNSHVSQVLRGQKAPSAEIADKLVVALGGDNSICARARTLAAVLAEPKKKRRVSSHSRPTTDSSRGAPTVLIVTALDIEYAAVRAFIRDMRELVHPSGTVYEQGLFDADDLTWYVAMVQAGIGNVIAAIETARALDTFRPDLAIFVGVAGGLSGLELGDVVAADYVYGYESGKYAETLRSRIKTFGSGYPLVQRARVVGRHDGWHKRISSGAKPRAFVGPIASGELVIAGENTPTHQLLEDSCDDAYAVEMEGWGFLFAAHTNGDIPAIVIRGISDLTIGRDLAADLRNQPMAAEHAAAFAFELLATMRSAGSTDT